MLGAAAALDGGGGGGTARLLVRRSVGAEGSVVALLALREGGRGGVSLPSLFERGRSLGGCLMASPEESASRPAPRRERPDSDTEVLSSPDPDAGLFARLTGSTNPSFPFLPLVGGESSSGPELSGSDPEPSRDISSISGSLSGSSKI